MLHRGGHLRPFHLRVKQSNEHQVHMLEIEQEKHTMPMRNKEWKNEPDWLHRSQSKLWSLDVRSPKGWAGSPAVACPTAMHAFVKSNMKGSSVWMSKCLYIYMHIIGIIYIYMTYIYNMYRIYIYVLPWLHCCKRLQLLPWKDLQLVARQDKQHLKDGSWAHEGSWNSWAIQ